MQVYSVNSFSPSRVMMANKAVEQPSTQVPQPEVPAAEPVKSVYFGNKEKGNGLKAGAMAVLIPISLLTGAGSMSSCGDKEDCEVVKVEATSSATANATATATAVVEGDGCHHGDCHKDSVDTVYITKYDTCYIDTGSYHTDTIEVEKWRDNYDKPIPLDTLTKHMYIFDVDDADTVNNKNIIHYEYTREWEYNNRAIANINILESAMNKNVLVHDVDVRDYLGNHSYYGKEVRRIPSSPVKLQNKNGSTVRTDKGIFLELYKNPNDQKNVSLFDSELQERYFLQTAGDSVKVYQFAGNNTYVEKGRVTKGYLGNNSILLKNCIGDYPTEDHLVDVVIKSVNDDMLKEMYVRARDDEETYNPNASKTRADAWRNF